MKKNLLAVAVLSSLSLSAFAGGFQAGDMVVRGGLVNVQPDSSEFTIYAGGEPVDLGLGNLLASVEDDTQVSLNFVYFYDSNWAVEVLAATPFSHDITVNLGDGTKTNLGKTKHLPPTVSALYYFDTNSNFKPYVGAGVNYTFFFDEKFNSAMEGPDSPLELSDLKLKNSWGLSAQIGADYYFDDNWSINASVRYIDIHTKARFKALDGAADGHVNVDIDPMVYSLQVGYKF
ncbi:outer membrane beta-barrel protein [Thalassotalea sp. LPB0316]|uniref:OmpW/AlkL family protein n=1 Tax=Thalassotalea sp. LPB0316 TaxID=2769490 RepID=UPI001866A557|nr:OmpW family outer membrane protein [Thalassotalea sp. LPB0316]QOL26415.1 outer membrane beta-barrel protein [Thalassotalea sp. LPB0316]